MQRIENVVPERGSRWVAISLVMVAVALGGGLASLLPRGENVLAQTETRWWKGNTHTHTLNSDGDSSPGEVSHWYRDHGYDFLVISDHNYHTSVDELQREFDREVHQREKRPFLLIPGEEVTDNFEDAPIHINGVDTARLVGPQHGNSKLETLQRNVDAIHRAGGIPSVNHPNFRWALSAEDLAGVKGLKHFEVYNGHPGVHNAGGGGAASLEEMWDTILTQGNLLYGVAVDDAHDFKSWGRRKSNPGRGWVMVRAAELSRKAIRAALERGDFYASTGVALSSVVAADGTLSVHVEPDGVTKFAVDYIGAAGKVLARESALQSSYRLRPDDLYVRCRVTSSRGELAWTQPLFRQGALRDQPPALVRGEAAAEISPPVLPTIRFTRAPGEVAIYAGDKPVATYYYADEATTRPYFAHVHAPSGIQVTRNHPPREGDAQDHRTFHPGLWLAFGDLSGHDNWRLKAKVVGGELLESPDGGPGAGSFVVRNRYLTNDGGETICVEHCRYTFLVRPGGYLLISDSVFRSDDGDFYFGETMDEMGFSLRMATPLTVKSNQGGRILSSNGDVNESAARETLAAWCDYSGTIDGKPVGITLFGDPRSDRLPWWHARDYGFMAANPFRSHEGRADNRRVTVRKGESFRLLFGVWIHGDGSETPSDPARAYADFRALVGE